MSINCNRNYIIYNLLDSPDLDLLVINLHFAFICACFGGILQTFTKCQTLGQFFESLYLTSAFLYPAEVSITYTHSFISVYLPSTYSSSLLCLQVLVYQYGFPLSC